MGKPLPMREHLRTGLLVAGVVIAAANLRGSLTSVGPLVGEIRSDTGISGGAPGLRENWEEGDQSKHYPYEEDPNYPYETNA